MKSRRYQAQEPQYKNQKKDQNQKSPEKSTQHLNGNIVNQNRQENDIQRQNNSQKVGQSSNIRQEKQSSKQTTKQQNFLQNQFIPTSPFQAPSNSYQQIAQQMQNAVQVMPQPQFQIPSITQQFPSTASMLNMNTPAFMGTSPFQPPAQASMHPMNIDSQQYFELQKQIILQQHVIQMQAQVAQLQQVAQQQKMSQNNPYGAQQLIGQQQVFDMGFNATPFADTSLIQNYNHQNFQKFDDYQQHGNNRNEEQSSDQISSQDAQKKTKGIKKQGNYQQKESQYKNQKGQIVQNNQKDIQRSVQLQNEKNQNKKGTQKYEGNQNNSYSDDEIQDQESSQNQSHLLGKRKLGGKFETQLASKQGGLTKQVQTQQNKASKIKSGKDLNENNNLAANHQNMQNETSGFRRSTRSIAKYEPINQGQSQKNKDLAQQNSGQKKFSPRKAQVQSQKNNRSYSSNLNSSQKKSSSPIEQFKDNSQSPKQGKFNSKNSSPIDKKAINSKSANSNTDTVVANEYAQILVQNKKHNKIITDNLLENQSKRTTRNQLKKFANGEQSIAQTTFLELGDYGRKQTVRLQKINDQDQKKSYFDKKNPRNKLQKDKLPSKSKNELHNIIQDKREAQTQIVQSQKILRRKSAAYSVEHQSNDSDSKNYDSEEQEDSELMAELAREKNGVKKQKVEEPKVEKIHILDDQQLKDMTVLFGMSQEQIDEIKKRQEDQLKALQEKSILFGEKINQQNSNLSQKLQNVPDNNKNSTVLQNSQIQSIIKNDYQQDQEKIKIQEFQSINNQSIIKDEHEDSEMSDNQFVNKSKTQQYQDDVKQIEIKNNIVNQQSNDYKQNHQSDQEVQLFGQELQKDIQQKRIQIQKNNQLDERQYTTQEIHQGMKYNVKYINQDYENLQKQIEQLQERIQSEKQKDLNQNLIQTKIEIQNIENVLNEEKAQDIEMKIELSELDDEMSEQTESIQEYQQQTNTFNQYEQKYNQSINEDLQRQEIARQQKQEIENRLTEQRNQIAKQKESIKYDRELANILKFPQKIENLIDFQKLIDQSLNLLYSRQTQSTLSNLREMVEKSCFKQFSLKNLRQLMFIAPQLYSHHWELKQGKMELVIQATSYFEELISLQFTKEQEYQEKIASLPFKSSHIKNREIVFRQLAFQHLLNDFEKFIGADEHLQSYNIFYEKKWPAQFDIENELYVPQIPLGAIKEQPQMQQRSTVQEFINANDSKSKFREIYNQMQEEDQKMKSINQSQEIVKKIEKKSYQNDDNSSDSETEDDKQETNVLTENGISQQTQNLIQLKKVMDEQEKQNKKELQKQQEAKANAETLVQISDQIWSIFQQNQSSIMYINKVLEKIIDNKRGQFWSKETLYEKIKLLSKICNELYQIQNQPGGMMLKVHKNLNLQHYNVHRRVHEYFNNDLQNINGNTQVSNKPETIQKQNFNNDQISQDALSQSQNRSQQQNHRSISSDRNIQSNQGQSQQIQDNSANQNKYQNQNSSAFTKFQRQISQNQYNNHQYEQQNQLQNIYENLAVQRVDGQNIQRHSNDEQGRGNSNENIFYRKQSNEKQIHIVQNNFKNEQETRQKIGNDNQTIVSSVGTFLTGEECQSNKSIDIENQQKHVIQQQKINQLTLREESAFTPQQQYKVQGSAKNFNSAVGTNDFARELLEVTSQQAQAKSIANNINVNQNFGERQMKFQSPDINAQVFNKQYQQPINLSNQNQQKSNIPEIMEKVYQPAQQNVNIYQMNSTNSFQNQMFNQQKQIIQNQRPNSMVKEGEQFNNNQYHQNQGNKMKMDQHLNRNGSYSAQAEFSENFNQRMNQQRLNQSRNIQN